jgi:hypothetical protein
MDLKTLQLASIQLTPELLAQYLTYHQTLVRELDGTGAGLEEWAGRNAFAHGKALAASGLDALTLGKLKSLVFEFCGQRSTAQVVRQRMDQARAAIASAKDAGRPPEPQDEALVVRAQAEIFQLNDMTDFAERYGLPALQLLVPKEAELLALHHQLAKLEGGCGVQRN